MRPRNKKFNPFFFGFCLFLIGIIGIVHHYWLLRQEQLHHFFPSDVAFFAEMKVTPDVLKEVESLFPEFSFQNFLEPLAGSSLSIDWEKDIASWLGSRMGVAVMEDKSFLMAFEFQNKSELKEFLNHFKAHDEQFLVNKLTDVEIFSPTFSSHLAFGFHGRWFLVADKDETLIRTFSSDKKLQDNEEYNRVFASLSRTSIGRIFVDTDKALNLVSLLPALSIFNPLLDTFAHSVPALGFSANLSDKGLSIDALMFSGDKPFTPDAPSKSHQALMPQLAQFASKDILFFINGSDFYQKYLETKDFLRELNPQMALVFEGILRARFQKFFGEDFDFEHKFLSLMHGQYTILLDFKNDLYPFLQLTLVTKMGQLDKDKSLESIHEAVRYAQSRYSTKVDEVRLPDGSVRKELVAVDEKEIDIQEITFNDHVYYTVESDARGTKLTYGMIDGYFVFSTHEDGMKSIIQSKQKTSPSLLDNSDFRESVLFHFPTSESYGFVNISKFTSAFEFIAEKPISTVTFLRDNFRTTTFARKIMKNMIYFNLMFFAR